MREWFFIAGGVCPEHDGSSHAHLSTERRGEYGRKHVRASARARQRGRWGRASARERESVCVREREIESERERELERERARERERERERGREGEVGGAGGRGGSSSSSSSSVSPRHNHQHTGRRIGDANPRGALSHPSLPSRAPCLHRTCYMLRGRISPSARRLLYGEGVI